MFEEYTGAEKRDTKQKKRWQELREKAWIGDAVVELYVREALLLRFKNNTRGMPNCSRFISNEIMYLFSKQHGTVFEAAIYDLYKAERYTDIRVIVNELIDFGLTGKKPTVSMELLCK